MQDMGDGLHTDINAYDSAFLFDVRRRLQQAGEPAGAHSAPWAAIHRATIDSGLRRHATASRTRATTRSPASTSPTAIPPWAACSARSCRGRSTYGWRVFYTQQHGDNQTWEIIPERHSSFWHRPRATDRQTEGAGPAESRP